ncbi:MAG: carboxypeptidase regulatory-like domain-containing protein [Candidatus Latescibacter sp.]|nr:carboxypeptidase regulatory-like domain-containing protein [Candidatus Latescibacter sp.]
MSIRKLSLFVLVVLFQLYVSGCSKSKGTPSPLQPIPVTPQIESTYRITGSVLGPTGNPVENAKVSILTTTNAAFTDVNGKYSFENVNVGAYTLAGVKEGYTYAEVKSVVTVNGSSTPDLILKDVREITGRTENVTTGSAIKTNGVSVVSVTQEQVSTGTGSVTTEKKEVKASIPANTVITIDNKVVSSAITVSAAPLQVSELPPPPKNEMPMGAAVFEPQGATFSQPVSVTVPMTIPLPAGLELPLKKYENGQWNTIGTATINASGTGADAKVSEFGQLAVQPKINVNLTPDPKPQEVKAAPINVPAGQTSYVAQTTDAVKFPSGLPKGVSVEYATSLIEKMKSTKIGISKNVVIRSPSSQVKAAAKVARIAGVEEVVETAFTVVKKTVTNQETITITIDTANLAKQAKLAELIEIVITYEYVTETWDQVSTQTVKYEVKVTLTGASGVSVTMTEILPNGSSGTSSTLSNVTENTVFTFLGLPNKNYTIVPQKPGFTFSPTSVTTGNLLHDVSYAFTATPIISKIPITGTVSGADTVTVKLTDASGLIDQQVVNSSGGGFTFSVDPNKNYTVTPSKTGYTFAPLNAAVPVGTTAVNLASFVATRTTASISGMVNGANGVKVTLKGGPAGTADTVKDNLNAGESYTFVGVQTGYTYTVGATKGSVNDVWIVDPALPGYTINLTPAGGDVTGKDFNVKKEQKNPTITASVSGTSGVTVILTGANGSTQTVNDSYTWTNLTKGTSYTLTASKTGVTFVQSSVTFSNLQSDKNFEFKAINNVTISGTLKRPNVGNVVGTAINGATVTLGGDAPASTTSNASGYYSFSVQTNKSYTITPSLAGYTFSPSSSAVSVGTSDVPNKNFTGTQFFTISGTVTGFAGVTVAYTGTLGNGSQVVTLNGGTYSFQVKAGGTYTLSATLSGITFNTLNIGPITANETHNINRNAPPLHNQGSIQ